MNINDYLIDQNGHNWSEILSDWHSLLPESFTLWLVNRFGDLFIINEDDSVHMLDIGSCTLTRIADNREDFANKIDKGDNANQWLMIPLVDKCVQAGLVLGSNQCYSYKHPPILGGDFSVSNTELCDISVHYSIYGQIYQQTKNTPNGTKVNIKIDGKA